MENRKKPNPQQIPTRIPGKTDRGGVSNNSSVSIPANTTVSSRIPIIKPDPRPPKK